MWRLLCLMSCASLVVVAVGAPLESRVPKTTGIRAVVDWPNILPVHEFFIYYQPVHADKGEKADRVLAAGNIAGTVYRYAIEFPRPGTYRVIVEGQLTDRFGAGRILLVDMEITAAREDKSRGATTSPPAVTTAAAAIALQVEWINVFPMESIGIYYQLVQAGGEASGERILAAVLPGSTVDYTIWLPGAGTYNVIVVGKLTSKFGEATPELLNRVYGVEHDLQPATTAALPPTTAASATTTIALLTPATIAPADTTATASSLTVTATSPPAVQTDAGIAYALQVEWINVIPVASIGIYYQLINSGGEASGERILAAANLPGSTVDYTIRLPGAGTYNVIVVGELPSEFGGATHELLNRVYGVGLVDGMEMALRDPHVH